MCMVAALFINNGCTMSESLFVCFIARMQDSALLAIIIVYIGKYMNNAITFKFHKIGAFTES